MNDRSTGDARGEKRMCGCTGVDAHLAVPVGADSVVTGRAWYHSTALVTARSAVRVPSVIDELFRKVFSTAIGVALIVRLHDGTAHSC